MFRLLVLCLVLLWFETQSKVWKKEDIIEKELDRIKGMRRMGLGKATWLFHEVPLFVHLSSTVQTLKAIFLSEYILLTIFCSERIEAVYTEAEDLVQQSGSERQAREKSQC